MASRVGSRQVSISDRDSVRPGTLSTGSEPAILLAPRLEPGPRRDRWTLVAIVAAAVLFRLALIVSAGGRLDDPDNYLPLARSLVSGDGLAWNGRPTAYRPPLYPILLSPLVATRDESILAWGIAGLHLVLGGGTVVLIAMAARRLGHSSGRSLLAAAIVAFDPVLAVLSRSVMTETLAAFLVASTLYFLTIPAATGMILGGIGFGLATLCRPSLLPAAGLTACAAMAFGTGDWKHRAVRAGLMIVATVAMLAPWAARNAMIFGEPVWTTTHGGYTLALANNPVYYRDVLDGPPGAVWSGEGQARWQAEINRSMAGLGEPEADRRIAATAWRLLRDRPGDFARASLARLGRFWGIAPSAAVYPAGLRAATAMWTIPLWVALAAGLCRRETWRWPGVAAPSAVVALTIVHAFYWTDLRMRSPIVPAIALVAVGGLGVLLGSWRSRREASRAKS